MAWNRKLGRTSSQRKAMLRNLATDVIVKGRITTTVTRAKEVQSVVEELITLGKKNNLHAIRQASGYVRPVVVDKSTNKTALQVLFNDVAPKYADVNGGYTRILRVGARRGDNAEMAIIELV